MLYIQQPPTRIIIRTLNIPHLLLVGLVISGRDLPVISWNYYSNHLIVVIVCGHRKRRELAKGIIIPFSLNLYIDRTQKEDAEYIGAQGMPTIESAMPGNQLNQETTMWTMSIKSRVKSSLNAPSADDDDGAQQLSL